VVVVTTVFAGGIGVVVGVDVTIEFVVRVIVVAGTGVGIGSETGVGAGAGSGAGAGAGSGMSAVVDVDVGINTWKESGGITIGLITVVGGGIVFAIGFAGLVFTRAFVRTVPGDLVVVTRFELFFTDVRTFFSVADISSAVTGDVVGTVSLEAIEQSVMLTCLSSEMREPESFRAVMRYPQTPRS